jgi:xanthine dehydrogenase FAD-binding subunit
MTVAVSIELEGRIIRDIKISAGSVFPTASRIPEVEGMLKGQEVSGNLLEMASCKAAELMIRDSGYRWSTPYKEPVLIGLLKRTLEEAVECQKSRAGK